MGFSQSVSLFRIVNTPSNAYSDPQCQRSRRVGTQCLRTFLPALLTVYSARTAFPCNNIGCITLIPCVRHLKSLVSLVPMFRHGRFSHCTTGNPHPICSIYLGYDRLTYLSLYCHGQQKFSITPQVTLTYMRRVPFLNILFILNQNCEYYPY